VLLSVSGQLQNVKLLVEAGADVDAKDNMGETAVHKATRHGHSSVISLLIMSQANVNMASSNGESNHSWFYATGISVAQSFLQLFIFYLDIFSEVLHQYIKITFYHKYIYVYRPTKRYNFAKYKSYFEKNVLQSLYEISF